MKFRDVFRYAWMIALLLFVIEAVRWWLGFEARWSRAVDYSFWAAAVLCAVAWGHKDEVAAYEHAELERWRRAWADHDRWLAEFSDVDLVLSNLKAQAEGKELCVMWPPGATGPWEVSRLQEVLRQRARAGVPGLSG